MPSRSANRLRRSNFTLAHKERLDLTLASPLASSSPSVPPSAGARSFSTRSVSPAKESREALPRGQCFGSDHEVFKSHWQLPPPPPLCPLLAGNFTPAEPLSPLSLPRGNTGARAQPRQRHCCSVLGGFPTPRRLRCGETRF